LICTSDGGIRFHERTVAMSVPARRNQESLGTKARSGLSQLRHGCDDFLATRFLGPMQTRDELYKLIGYHEFEALDAPIVKTVLPKSV
jgi:hypothetical protein